MTDSAPEYTTDSCCSAEHPCPTHRDLYRPKLLQVHAQELCWSVHGDHTHEEWWEWITEEIMTEQSKPSIVDHSKVQPPADADIEVEFGAGVVDSGEMRP